MDLSQSTVAPRNAITSPSTFDFTGLRSNQSPTELNNVVTNVVSAQSTPIRGTPARRTNGGTRLRNAIPTNITTSNAWLPIPQVIETEYQKNWSDHGTLLDSRGNVFQSDGNLNQVAEALHKIGKIGKFSAGELAGDRVGATQKYNSRQAFNSRLKILFESIPFRTFSFPWLLQPKSAGEAQQIDNWIYELKLRSAPFLDEGEVFFRYPDTFRLQWFNRGDGGGGSRLGDTHPLFSTGELVCTGVSVNYTPQGMWSQHHDGFSTSIQVTASFMETELATRDNIARGF